MTKYSKQRDISISLSLYHSNAHRVKRRSAIESGDWEDGRVYWEGGEGLSGYSIEGKD